jgi:hypothetical protein
MRPPDVATCDFYIEDRYFSPTAASNPLLAFEIGGTKCAPSFSSRRTNDEKIY